MGAGDRVAARARPNVARSAPFSPKPSHSSHGHRRRTLGRRPCQRSPSRVRRGLARRPGQPTPLPPLHGRANPSAAPRSPARLVRRASHRSGSCPVGRVCLACAASLAGRRRQTTTSAAGGAGVSCGRDGASIWRGDRGSGPDAGGSDEARRGMRRPFAQPLAPRRNWTSMTSPAQGSMVMMPRVCCWSSSNVRTPVGAGSPRSPDTGDARTWTGPAGSRDARDAPSLPVRFGPDPGTELRLLEDSVDELR